MATKFIKVSAAPPADEYYINPLFIVSITKVKITNKTLIQTMDGNKIYTDDSLEQIMEKIKKSETFTFTNK